MPVIQGLDPELIAYEGKLVFLLVVNDESPEAHQIGENVRAPAGPGVEQHFGIAGATQYLACPQEAILDLEEVVQLTVVCDDVPFIFHGLGAQVIQPNDGQPGVGHAEVPIGPEANRIGTSAAQAAHEPVMKGGVNSAGCKNSTHMLLVVCF